MRPADELGEGKIDARGSDRADGGGDLRFHAHGGFIPDFIFVAITELAYSSLLNKGHRVRWSFMREHTDGGEKRLEETGESREIRI